MPRAPQPPQPAWGMHRARTGEAAQDATALAVYADMVEQVKAYYKLQDRGLSRPLKVVISQRSEGQLSQRVITNAQDVAAALALRGIDTQVRRQPRLALLLEAFCGVRMVKIWGCAASTLLRRCSGCRGRSSSTGGLVWGMGDKGGMLEPRG